MPIRPENRDRYPGDWPLISALVRFARAAGRCECVGECGRPRRHLAVDGRCPNRHGHPDPDTRRRVVLTTAHLNHIPEDCDPTNLRAWCAPCHVHHDAPHHAATRRRTHIAHMRRIHHPLLDLDDDGTDEQESRDD